MPLSECERELLGQDLLTFIEQREAEQITYGVYDITMTGAEVIAYFRPLSVALPADADRAPWPSTAWRRRPRILRRPRRPAWLRSG